MIFGTLLHEAFLWYFLFLFLTFSVLLAYCIRQQRTQNWHVRRPATHRCSKCYFIYVLGRFEEDRLCTCPRCGHQDPNPKHKIKS